MSLREDLCLDPGDDGVSVHGASTGRREVAWADLAAVCGTRAPLSTRGQRALSLLLRIHRRLAELGPAAGAEWVYGNSVLLALAPGHLDHLGGCWAHHQVPGGALQVGLGIHLDDAGPAVPLPDSVTAGLGLAWRQCWPEAVARVERYSTVAAQLLGRDGRNSGTLRPVARCDVPTLLSCPPLRCALAERDGVGMASVAAPNRTRGWFDLARVDPAYVGIVWQLTDEAERGLPRPVLITPDAVSLPPVAGDLSRHAVERY